jgi:hypothetical protein
MITCGIRKGETGMASSLNGCIERLEHRSLLPADHLAVFCVGSVARGWANTNSDLDLTVVTSGPWHNRVGHSRSVPLQVGRVPVVEFQDDGHRWQVKYWQDRQVDQMLEKVGWAQFEGNAGTAKALSEAEELFLERLVSCLPLSGAGWVESRRRQLKQSAFRAFVTTRSLVEADSAVEDALGQLAAQDLESAVLSARKAFGHSVDALLESSGSYGSRLPKWRARRFREVSPSALSFEEYWRVETMRDFDPAAPEVWVRTVIDRCKSLSLDVEIS